MSVYDLFKRSLGIADAPPPHPAMAQITIISTAKRVKRPSGTRSPQPRD